MAGGGAQLHAAYSVRTLAASAAHTVSEETETTYLPIVERGCIFVLDYTADESTALDTCDVYVQTALDAVGGTGTENWTDVVHFVQHVGNQGDERRIAKILTDGILLEQDNAAVLAAGQVRHAFGDVWRVRVVIVDNSTDASFTFSVTAIPQHG